MGITTTAIKELRELTGAGIMDCKVALEESGGDLSKAVEILRERGIAIAAKKESRAASDGLVEAYIHSGGRIGAMVELNCETDFVARTDQFKALAHNLAMQIAAMNPSYIGDGDVADDEAVERKESCLLEQPFIKDEGKTIRELILEHVALLGETIKVRRFARFELGKDEQ